MLKSKLTSLEKTVIENLFESAIGNGHDFGFVEDHGINPKVARGVLSSLVQKKLIEIHDPITNDSGTWTQFTWFNKNPEDINSLDDIVENDDVVIESIRLVCQNTHQS
jgi:transcription initiation factor IIE alpha subunit